MQELKAAGGGGGVIGLDKNGGVIMSFNTSGMYRGYKNKNQTETLIYKVKESKTTK